MFLLRFDNVSLQGRLRSVGVSPVKAQRHNLRSQCFILRLGCLEIYRLKVEPGVLWVNIFIRQINSLSYCFVSKYCSKRTGDERYAF